MIGDLSQNQHRTDVALKLHSPNGMVFQTAINKMKGEMNQMAFGITSLSGHSSRLFLIKVSSANNFGGKENVEENNSHKSYSSISMCHYYTYDSNQWHIKIVNVNSMLKKSTR